MGLYNFQPRFVPYVEEGSKTHTIRAARKTQDKAGNTVHLYTGLRRKGARLLLRAKCTRVQSITVTRDGDVIIDGTPLSADERDLFFWGDGFRPKDSSQSNPRGAFRMAMRFWKDQLPFTGHIIHWDFKGASHGRR